jgi:hypothetical protein
MSLYQGSNISWNLSFYTHMAIISEKGSSWYAFSSGDYLLDLRWKLRQRCFTRGRKPTLRSRGSLFAMRNLPHLISWIWVEGTCALLDLKEVLWETPHYRVRPLTSLKTRYRSNFLCISWNLTKIFHIRRSSCYLPGSRISAIVSICIAV